MAELADALGSGPSVRKDIGVQVPFRAKFIISIPSISCQFNFYLVLISVFFLSLFIDL